MVIDMKRVAILLLVSVLAVTCGGATTATPTSTPATTQAALPAAGSPASASSGPATSAATQVTKKDVRTCTSPATPTIEMTEGPFYKSGAPQKVLLAPTGMAGTRIVVSGYVLTTTCQPVSGAKVDVWQADASGNYDNSGYTLRGYVLTDSEGRYSFETIVPGLYPGRTEHIHVKVWGNISTLTTQLYFPGVAQNAQDSIFNSANVLKITDGTPLQGRFDFVLSRP